MELPLEGNPIAKKLGWKWGIPLNVALCFGFAFWPLPAIVISTTSVLVAARNFQSAWLMRSMGEQLYRDWHVERVQETSITLYLYCLFAQTALTGGVGVAVIGFSEWRLAPLGDPLRPPGGKEPRARKQPAAAQEQREDRKPFRPTRRSTAGKMTRRHPTCIRPHSKSS